jgi:hypothetical protein
VVHKISRSPSTADGADRIVDDDEPLIDGAIARVFIRRDASTRSLRRLAICPGGRPPGLCVGGRVRRSGYWTTVDIEMRSDLDQLRAKARRLIDGWRNFR